VAEGARRLSGVAYYKGTKLGMMAEGVTSVLGRLSQEGQPELHSKTLSQKPKNICLPYKCSFCRKNKINK
jgi:hypothetical protein